MLQLLFTSLLILIIGYSEFGVICLARESEGWLPVNGYISENTDEKSTASFMVGKKIYRTDCENVFNIFEKQYNFKSTMSRHNRSRTVINGVDSELGKHIKVYYDPNNPSSAVIEKGWTQPVVLQVLFGGILLLGCIYSLISYPERASHDDHAWYGG